MKATKELIGWLDVKIGALEDQYEMDRVSGDEHRQSMTHAALRAYRDVRENVQAD